ncbi:MAG: four helix bundle protein [Candidatus Margulisbacteria bacterium]|jgi:four helix bundle protein|nr:four helix bundle protein [Candidatus Margulisiibacteriota bacterium]
MPFRFLKFPVYQDIKEYIGALYAVSAKFPKDEQFGLTSQLRRAATSIALNIAEGSDRGSDSEFSRFIQMAIGSLNETVAVLDLASECGFMDKSNYDIMIGNAELIVKQLSGLRKTLRSDQ